MIRFLDLTEDIWMEEVLEQYPETLAFAWYCTSTDKILSFNDNNVWDSWEDFERDYLESWNSDSLERYRTLFVTRRKEKP